MSNVTPPPVTRSTPYVASHAPTSPVLLMVAGGLVSVVVWIAGRWGVTLPVDGTTAAQVAAALATLWGLFTTWLSRREQVDGVPLLRKALASLPPPPDTHIDVSESIERLKLQSDVETTSYADRFLALLEDDLPSPENRMATTDQLPVRLTWPVDGLPDQERRFAATAHAHAFAKNHGLSSFVVHFDAADQLHALDPSAPHGLDKWSGKALRLVIDGAPHGEVGPISWAVADDTVRISIDGYLRVAQRLDWEDLARALGASKWLEASRNALRDRFPKCEAPGCNATSDFEQGHPGALHYWCEEHPPTLKPGDHRRRHGEAATLRRLGVSEANDPATTAAVWPRKHMPSNALLGDDGEPVSAGDLDEDPDPDERISDPEDSAGPP